MIYIRKIFDEIIKVVLNIISLLFVNNLGFIISAYLIKTFLKVVEKVDIVKIIAVFFFNHIVNS